MCALTNEEVGPNSTLTEAAQVIEQKMGAA